MIKSSMEFTFPNYLLSKQGIDSRALNKDVFNALRTSLPETRLRIIEVGAGIGTMVKRLIEWDLLRKAEYVLVDEMAENIEFARVWLPHWAEEAGLNIERSGADQFRLFDEVRDVNIHLQCADVFQFIKKNEKPADLLIAHAFLDLLPLPQSLSDLFSLTKNLAWFTLNFDGVTTLEPVIDAALDEKIERLYHRSMDERPSGGESKSGRRLFHHLRASHLKIVAAGASDWVVYAQDRAYPPEEAFFLHFILNFFEQSLQSSAELEKEVLAQWLTKRREHIERGELVYVAHQIDFLVKRA